MSEKNIYQRINAVMQEVEYVQKDKQVSGGGVTYKAVTHDQVTAVVRKAMVKNGIVVRLEQKSSEMIQQRDLEKNIKMHLYAGTYDVHFVNVDKIDQFATVSITAHAADNGDKAPGKAASYATKYAMLKLFSLETGENDESRTAEPVTHSDIQKDQFDDLMAKQDVVGMACFEQTVGQEVMTSLNNSFEKGKISEGKKELRRLAKMGYESMRNTSQEISSLISSEDPAVSEVVDEMGDMEKRLVAKHLTAEEIQYLRNIK